MSLINQFPRFLNRRFSQDIVVKHLQGEHSTDDYKAKYIEEKMTVIVMPTSPNDVQLLPDGERFLPSIKIYTENPLKIGDLVDYLGVTYKIKTVGNWGDYGYHNNIGVRHSQTAKVDSRGFEVT